MKDRKHDGSASRMSGAGGRLGRHPGWPAEVADVLGGLTDREDLARLFERNVDLPTIVRLMGRQVTRDTIRRILELPDPGAEARRLLD